MEQKEVTDKVPEKVPEKVIEAFNKELGELCNKYNVQLFAQMSNPHLALSPRSTPPAKEVKEEKKDGDNTSS